MKYVFFGSPRFAEIVLMGLIDAGMPPTVLVCNPDRPVGRKKVITPPATKKLVSELGIMNEELGVRVLQPESKEELTRMSDEIFKECDFGIVAAYAQIIPEEVIDKAKLGIIGVHPSLLPKLRGASPIQGAILGGFEETGVSLFMIDEDVDHGPVLASDKIQVTSDMGYAQLEKELAGVGARLLVEVLPKFVAGEIKPEVQDETLATYTDKYSTEDGYVDPNDLEETKLGGEKATQISRKIRALNPEPGVYTILDGKRTKLLKAELIDGKLKLTEIQTEGGLPRKIV